MKHNPPLVPTPNKYLVDFIKAIGFNPYDLNVIYNTSHSASLRVNNDLIYHFYADDAPFNTVSTLSIWSNQQRCCIDRAVFSLKKDGEWVEDPSFQYLL